MTGWIKRRRAEREKQRIDHEIAQEAWQKQLRYMREAVLDELTGFGEGAHRWTLGVFVGGEFKQRTIHGVRELMRQYEIAVRHCDSWCPEPLTPEEIRRTMKECYEEPMKEFLNSNVMGGLLDHQIRAHEEAEARR